MMYFLIILFFGSLSGITFMIGRKYLAIQNGEVVHHENFFKDSSLEDLKRILEKRLKKYIYLGLVVTVRLYVHSVNFLKNKSHDLRLKVIEIYHKKVTKGKVKNKEVSGFLKMISEYKHKIRKIRRQIKEEEDL